MKLREKMEEKFEAWQSATRSPISRRGSIGSLTNSFTVT